MWHLGAVIFLLALIGLAVCGSSSSSKSPQSNAKSIRLMGFDMQTGVAPNPLINSVQERNSDWTNHMNSIVTGELHKPGFVRRPIRKNLLQRGRRQ